MKAFSTAMLSLGLQRRFAAALLALTVIAVFVPFSPDMPAPGVDPSWMFGLNHAVAQKLAFGKDMIFTFGPYVSVFTKLYHPATDTLMLVSCGYLGFCYMLAALALLSGARLRWTLAMTGVLAALMLTREAQVYSRDALLFSYPLLLCVLTFERTRKAAGAGAPALPGYVGLGTAFLVYSALGLLPLIKGSFIPLAVTSVLFCAFFLFTRDMRKHAAIVVVAPIVALVGFWMASGQNLTGLPEYFTGLVPIISGYTEAMARTESAREIILYLVASAVVLYLVSTVEDPSRLRRVVLTLSFAVFLFIAFKGGFVRHDRHAVMAGTCILFAVIALGCVESKRSLVLCVTLAVLAWADIDQQQSRTSTQTIIENVKSTYVCTAAGIKARVSDTGKWERVYAARLNAIGREYPIKGVKGPIDIYSYNQSYVLASGSAWSPRPVLQSYSAYTPSLANLNERHLVGAGAPETILFRVEPIDGRLPSLEDGPSWATVINAYEPIKLDSRFLYLKSKGFHDNRAFPRRAVSESVRALGEQVPLESSNGLLFAEIDIRPTIIGRLATLLFKPTQLQIELELTDGTRKVFRIVSGMAKAGFLISPLVSSTSEFAMLFGNPDQLSTRNVRAFRLFSNDQSIGLWQSNYTLKVSMPIVKAANPELVPFEFDPALEIGRSMGNKTFATNCEYSVGAAE